jgi:hypothetical protein
MATAILRKQPAESRVYSIDFVNLLKTGDSLATVTSVTATPAGLAVGTGTIDGTTVQFTLSSGTHGVQYYVEAVVATTLGEVLEGDGRIFVRDR